MRLTAYDEGLSSLSLSESSSVAFLLESWALPTASEPLLCRFVFSRNLLNTCGIPMLISLICLSVSGKALLIVAKKKRTCPDLSFKAIRSNEEEKYVTFVISNAFLA